MTYEEECEEIAKDFALMFSKCRRAPHGDSHTFQYETSKCIHYGCFFPYGEGSSETRKARIR